MRRQASHERNPILHAARDSEDYVRCRTCEECAVILASELPEALRADAGMCMVDMEPVYPDEPRTGEDADCWRERELC